MPEAETSQFHQFSKNIPPIGLSTKFSEPSEPQEVHLLIVEDDKGTREYPLAGDRYSIGRDSSCNIRLYSMFVSRRHATLVQQRREDGNYNYQIVDGNLQGQLSANGILVNGRKLPAHELEHGDKIIFGPGVSAEYRRLTGPLDPFDITLIDPGMIEESGK
ncbi:MAG TPA: FHA domain-containing protein [Coleofasciculaceae cyanobacterium]|jgi:pSer/pThr/pTyr-binding forkhead associated (FHA) protein